MLRSRLAGAVLAGSLILAGCAHGPKAAESAEVSSEAPAFTFEGEAISNDAVRLVVDGRVGRITHFGYADGPNLLWLGDPAGIAEQRAQEKAGWINYGGDKVWPSFQSAWVRQHTDSNWPPDTTIDGAVWEVERLGERRLRMTSPVSPYLNVRIVREIELDEVRPRVVIRNTIERTGRSPFPVHIWSVSQTAMPLYTLAGVSQARPQLAKGGELHALWYYGDQDTVSANITALAGGKAVRWDMDHEGGAKTGTLGTWGACVFDDVVLVHQTAYDPDGAYPDASDIHLYTHGEYAELETVSPQEHPRPGEAIHNTVVWTLLPREGRDDAAVVEAIEALPAVVDGE